MSVQRTIPNQNGRKTPTVALPPQAISTEMALLSSLFIAPGRLGDIRQIVKSPDFYWPAHQIIFRAMCGLADDGGAVDPVAVAEFLGRRGELIEVGHLDYLIELVETEPHAAHASHYAKIVKERAIERDLAVKLDDAKRLVYDPNLSVAEKVDFVDGLTAHLTVNRSERFPLVTAKELATSKYETKYLIHGILAANEFCILVGPQKTLKTSLALQMAVCLAVGARLFEMFVVPERMRVGFMSGESGPATVQNCFLRICTSMRISAEAIDNLAFCFSIPNLDVDADIAAAERFITANRLKVLFIDCFYRMISDTADKASNVFAMGAVLGKLMDLQSRTGCTICLLHHTTKHQPSCKPKLDNAAFAGSAEAARQWILLNRVKDYDTRSPGHHELWFVTGGSAGHSVEVKLEVDEGSQFDSGGRSWTVQAFLSHAPQSETSGDSDAGNAATAKNYESVEATRARNREKVLKAFELFPNGGMKTDIRGETKLNSALFNLALDELCQIGKVEKCPAVSLATGKPCDGLRLTRTHGDTSGHNPICPRVPADKDTPIL